MSDLSFELTDDTIDRAGRTLYRIRATRDIPVQRVVKGDLGGYVESTHLEDGWARIAGDGWVGGQAQVYGSARVYDEARVTGPAQVYGSARVSGSARVTGTARVYDEALVDDEARVSGEAQVSGSARITGTARVYGSARVSGSAFVTDFARVYGSARVAGSAFVSGSARIERREHVVMVSPIGPMGVTATLHRTETGHALHVGCWEDGSLDDLPAEVERRAEHWAGTDVQKSAWRAQYRALIELGRAAVALW